MPNKWLTKQQQEEPQSELEPEEVEMLNEDPGMDVATPTPSKRIYTWVKYDNIYDVARRLGVDPFELMEHNDLHPQVWEHVLAPGDKLHLFKDLDLPEDNPIRYEIKDEPMRMHVSKPGGTKWWAFASVRKWEDLTQIGYVPQNTNVDIVAIAHVPIGDQEAAYYMTARQLGDYQESGKVRFTLGFAWQDIAEGYYVAPEPKKVAEEVLKVETIEEAIEIDMKAQETKRRVSPNKYKESLQLFDMSAEVTAKLPDDALIDESNNKKFVWIYEHDNRRPEQKLFHNWEGEIIGTFTKEGVLYGLPTAAYNNGYWFGLPMEYLENNSLLYGLPKRTTPSERYLYAPLFKAYNMPIKYLHRYKKNKNHQPKKEEQ